MRETMEERIAEVIRQNTAGKPAARLPNVIKIFIQKIIRIQ